ncbi:hypothetical protein GCM10025857_36360 [Alicyclobacillus contaminans]|nr:hypothetical protein GCM10025857_36360 [Alicyclobacillus contaminans]
MARCTDDGASDAKAVAGIAAMAAIADAVIHRNQRFTHKAPLFPARLVDGLGKKGCRSLRPTVQWSRVPIRPKICEVPRL